MQKEKKVTLIIDNDLILMFLDNLQKQKYIIKIMMMEIR